MKPVPSHTLTPDASFDGGDLDCGNGLLLLLRRHLDPLERGQLLEIRSTEASVEEDLPAWCRLTANELVSWTRTGSVRSFLVARGSLTERRTSSSAAARPAAPLAAAGPVTTTAADALPGARPLPGPAQAPPIPPLAVTGMGSWPRPRWLLRALHERLEGRLPEETFEATADDAVRLAVAAQLRAGVDVVTDGEQRRDSYASFVGAKLENCQLIPLTDLLPLVDHPEEFAAELRALDVPAQEVRHPAVFGPLRRSRTLAAHELEFARKLTEKPLKVALPGPYLLTRTMWLECMSDRAYASREALSVDVIRILREEVAQLLAGGAALVQLDEPVLSEVVFSGARGGRTFMCGALGERRDASSELAFARDLMNAVVRGFPRERLALHVCRGNWTPNEGAALSGDYRPLLGYFRAVEVGTYLLELATPRAGEIEALLELPSDRRVGVGVVNPKRPEVETLEVVLGRCRKALLAFGSDRVLFHPDCGFATFADNPVASAEVAEGKLAVIAEAVRRLRGG